MEREGRICGERIVECKVENILRRFGESGEDKS